MEAYLTYENITWAWIIIGLIVFVVLQKITAPYGRHSTNSWGPMVSNRVGWIMMELPVLLVLYGFLLVYGKWPSNPVIVFVALFSIHYVNRSLIFPFRIKTRGKKMPFLIACSAIFFNLMNGSLLGYYFTRFDWYTNVWFTDPRFITGTLLFITGWAINIWADEKLMNLRKPGETGYKIPKGGLFNYISAPNLFGEVIEWAGFAILTWSLPGLTFFLWTCANLLPRAVSHHKWYREHFSDYPRERKAVIPFVW